MSRSIRVITFDLDNTLWDVEPVLHRAEHEQNLWLQEHRPLVAQHFDDEAMREFRFKAHGRHPELAHQISKIRIQALYEVQMHCGYTEDIARQGAEAAFSEFLRVRHQVEPYERALDTLELLAQSYVLGALSNGNADIYKTDIGEYFDFAFSAEQVDASKPLPDMFHAAMESSAASATEIVHVGDNPEHDVLGAQQVGMHTVWMNSGNWRWPAQRKAADEDNTDLADLPAAVKRIEQRLEA
mgnify:CR=1 FL=1